MTYKFKAKRKTDLNIEFLIPIHGEEPVLIQFHNGRYETDDDNIGESMIKSGFYGKLYVKDVPEKPKPKVEHKVKHKKGSKKK